MPSRWSPADRLALVERLQARSGAESESLFDAYSLGVAYRSAGDKNSKRARINAALHAAQQRGSLDEVLDAVAHVLGVEHARRESEPTSLNDGATAVPVDKPIFLSHASADKALADLFRDTLVLGGVPEGRIFYSSDRSSGIPSGEDVGTYLQRSLQRAGLVVELVSETFLTRPMCLMELGGAWALGTPTYPIVVPPMTREQATSQIGNVQVGALGSEADISDIFNELHDRLAQNLGVHPKVTAWNRAIANFRQQLPSKLATGRASAAAAPIPPQVAAVAAAPDASDDKITIANVTVIAGSFGKELHGEATNRDTVEHSATIKGTFYGSEGKIVGTGDAMVNQLRPGGTKTFSMLDVPEHARVKVEADTVF